MKKKIGAEELIEKIEKTFPKKDVDRLAYAAGFWRGMCRVLLSKVDPEFYDLILENIRATAKIQKPFFKKRKW